MDNIKPSTKLSVAQRRVALDRAMTKKSNAYKGSAGGIASARMGGMQGLQMQQLEKPIEQQIPTDAGIMYPHQPEGAVEMPEISDVDQQVQAALIADQLWRDGGGDDSIGGQVWEKYRKASSDGKHLDNARDYFISSFSKWRSNPEGFKSKHPKEARLLQALSDEFEASQGGM